MDFLKNEDTFLKNYTFKYAWRGYQSRVLDELSYHFSDNKINVVAPPGAGKTVLGLEIIRRLNKNVLILSPTLVIKNQWLDRFLELFVKQENHPNFISTNIYSLNRFNVATYQALHYAYNRKKIVKTNAKLNDNEYDLIACIKQKNIEVVVLDEAHHLRSAWWKSLVNVLKELDGIKTVSLTATPPYDCETDEWEKYIQICGTIDSEISVAELVAAQDLCAHQDFIIFNKLTPKEETQINKIKADFDSFICQLKQNEQFVNAVASIPQLNNYNAYEEKILQNPQYYISLIIFLNELNVPFDTAIANALGGGERIPRLTEQWLEIMLEGVLFSDKQFIEANKSIIKDIILKLRHICAINKRKISLKDNDEVKRILDTSMGKMQSISEIVLNEYGTLDRDLSMVILTDYVKAEALKNNSYEKIGVVPIFKQIIKDIGITPNDDNTIINKIANIAVLTGKLKIIPKTLIPFVPNNDEYEFNEIPIEGYVEIKTSAKNENKLVGIITQLMNQKKINIIVGTVALLGEGWDCQAVNSLILASFIGSFVVSNQMRGRAIRVDKTKNKVANIWHLASVSSIQNTSYNDYATLKRRFNNFLGIAYNEDRIESGIRRLDILNEKKLPSEYERINKNMYRISRTRGNTKNRWTKILASFGGEDIKIVRTLKKTASHNEKHLKAVSSFRANKSLFAAIVATIIISIMLKGLLFNFSSPILRSIFYILFGAIFFVFVFKYLTQSFTYLGIIKTMKSLSKINLCALMALGHIKSQHANVIIRKTYSGDSIQYETTLIGATAHENSLFIECIKETYGRINNPRYIIIVQGAFTKNKAYFNVPKIFCANKTIAQKFFNEWHKHIRNSKLLYTKSASGRSTLLKAAKGSFNYENSFSHSQYAIKS